MRLRASAMNVPLRHSDIDALRTAANLLALGRNVELERTADGRLECVEIVGDPSPETKAALEEQGEPIPNNDFDAWIDALD
jgi:hypothetical protein